ncbi:MAG: hypothetical protein ACPLPR_09540 [Bacillota bacterium]
MIGFVKAIGLMVDSPSAMVAVLKDGLVIDMSASAYSRGVREGMKGWEARLVAGELALASCSPEAFEKAQREFVGACKCISSGVKQMGYARALVDVGENKLDYEVLRGIDQVAQIVFVGVGINELVARIAAQLLEGEHLGSRSMGLKLKVVPAEATLEFLYEVPVSLLWPLGRATIEKLLKLGFRRVGEIRGVTPETLVTVFGRDGWKIWEIANGNYGVSFIPPLMDNLNLLKRVDGEVDRLEQLCFVLRGIASEAEERLRKAGCSYRELTLCLGLSSGNCVTRTRKFREAKGPESVGLILRLMVEELKLPCGVTEISVRISGLSALNPVQLTLDQPAPLKRRSLESIVGMKGVLTANQLVSRRERMLCYWDPLRGLAF